MIIVGLTGGIASGKSSVSRILQSERIKVKVIDCDEIAKEVVQPGKWGHKRIVYAFGREVLDDSGIQIDREKLGQLVFGNETARRKLNKATHWPVFIQLVWRIFLSWLQWRLIIVVDMPLLFETGSHKFCSKTVVVYCSRQQQIERMIARDGPTRTLVDATNRVDAQMALDSKRNKADFVIENSGGPQDLLPQVQTLLQAGLRHNRWSLRSLVFSPAAVVFGLGLGFALAVKFSS